MTLVQVIGHQLAGHWHGLLRTRDLLGDHPRLDGDVLLHAQAKHEVLDALAEQLLENETLNESELAVLFAKSGARDPSYDETQVSEAMKNPKIQIRIALGLGKGRDRVLTCDLTKEYIAINGDYRS